jgi:hypothetical protein
MQHILHVLLAPEVFIDAYQRRRSPTRREGRLDRNQILIAEFGASALLNEAAARGGRFKA